MDTTTSSSAIPAPARRPAPLPQTLKPPRFGAMRSISALMLREMESTYGRQPGGYIWAILQPVGMIVLLSLAFSMLVKEPPLGTSFIFFYASGFLPFDIYTSISGKISSALMYSRPLLSYPRVTWIDTILARLLLNAITALMVFFIVIISIMMLYETRARIDLGPLLIGLSMAITLGTGVGLVNCVLIGLFPVWGIIWAILSRPLFLGSGVLFLLEDMPTNVQSYLLWNPLIHVAGLVRRGLFSTYDAPYVSLAYGYGVGLLLCTIGLIFLRAHYKTVLQL
jgi:capsular polysaccharide transport system permease protein